MKIPKLKDLIREENKRINESSIINTVKYDAADDIIDELQDYEDQIPRRKFDEFMELAYEIADAEMGVIPERDVDGHRKYMAKELKKYVK